MAEVGNGGETVRASIQTSFSTMEGATVSGRTLAAGRHGMKALARTARSQREVYKKLISKSTISMIYRDA